MVDSVIIDLDYTDPVTILSAWSRLKAAGGTDIRGRVSSGKEGVHVKAIVPGSEWPHYHIRRIAGDDPDRIGKDMEKGWRPANVAFDAKGSLSAGPWVDCPFNLIDQLLTGVSYE